MSTVSNTTTATTTFYNSNATYIDLYELQSPVDCGTLRVIGWYCIMVMILSILLNATILAVFVRYKEMRTPINTLVGMLALMNLIGSLLEFPFVIISVIHLSIGIF
jgi:hypothetical protein